MEETKFILQQKKVVKFTKATMLLRLSNKGQTLFIKIVLMKSSLLLDINRESSLLAPPKYKNNAFCFEPKCHKYNEFFILRWH